MKDAEKMAMLIVGMIFLVSFINRGQAVVGTGPQGANLQFAYYGAVK